MKWFVITLCCSMFIALNAPSLQAFQDKADQAEEEQEKTVAFMVADERLQFSYPESWEKVDPRVNIIEAEFSIEKAEGDDNKGRLTIMGAGGSIEANIDRWIGQFSQPDGGSTDDNTKVDVIEVADQTVHIVDIRGTFNEQRGPVAPVTEREGYRMLAAIVETDVAGNYFLKFYGPEKTVTENEKRFMNFVKSLELN